MPQPGGRRADTRDDDRPASRPQRGVSAADVGHRARSIVLARRDGRSRRRGVEVQVDGTGRSGEAQGDRGPHLGRRGRRAEDERALGDRAEERGVVQALVRDAGAGRGRHAVADQQERLAIEQGVRDTVHRARRARTTGHDARARTAAELGRRRGHEHGRTLGVGEDEPQPLGLGRADHVQVAPAAGEPEQDLDTGVAESGGDQLRDASLAPLAHWSPLPAAGGEAVA